MTKDGKWRVGIDTGGTFTDIVATDGNQIKIGKVSSTPPDFETGVLNSISDVSIGVPDISTINHGTTATTNATITKTGARVALITTKGFRDVLELRRHNRGEGYDILWDPPEPLVPRKLRFEIDERMDFSGKVLKSVDQKDLISLVEILKQKELDAIAICFLHSYMNSENEAVVKDFLSAALPNLYISASSDLIKEPQEFERTSTTVVNSYVGPILNGYVERLRTALITQGYKDELLIMHSGGGLLPADTALAFPARTVTSGPAAGAMAVEGFTVSGAPSGGIMAVERMAQSQDIENIISLDMGGTSADIAVVREGKARLINEYNPEFGVTIRFPAVDLLTIGAGGGSIAWIDGAGAPQVGPQSAGARPGPACYGIGGEDATVTDANLVLGRLDENNPLAGDLKINLDLARKAVESFADKLGLSTDDAATGIIEIANSNMARAVRVMTVERGLDPRDFVLLPFGGAGSMHGCELADELSINKVLVPKNPGVLSALGTLTVDVVHDRAVSYINLLSDVDINELDKIFSSMEEDVTAQLESEGFQKKMRVIERSVDVRYLGQVKTLNMTIGNKKIGDKDIKAIGEQFFKAYEENYRYITDKIPLEIAVARVRARGIQDKLNLPEIDKKESPKPKGSREVLFERKVFKTPIYDREDFGSGSSIDGPAIIDQLDCTTVIPPSWKLKVDSYGNLMMEKEV